MLDTGAWLFALVVLASYFIQSITGFGASTFAIALGTLFLPTHTAVVTISMVGCVFSLLMILQDPKGVDWKEYLRIVFYCAIGMPLGLFLFNTLDGRMIKLLLGALMLAMGVYYILRDYVIKKEPILKQETTLTKILMRLLLVAAGVVHGATLSSGPLIVIYMTIRVRDKRTFRQTLGSLWVALNSFMVVNGIIQGQITPSEAAYAAVALPFLFLGAWLGKKVYEHVTQKTFMLAVYIILVASGAFMLL